MRINIYSQELLLDPFSLEPKIEWGATDSNTDIKYSYVRLFLHSSERLHHPPKDDDRSAITFWLPKSQRKREALAFLFQELAERVIHAEPETGLD